MQGRRLSMRYIQHVHVHVDLYKNFLRIIHVHVYTDCKSSLEVLDLDLGADLNGTMSNFLRLVLLILLSLLLFA